MAETDYGVALAETDSEYTLIDVVNALRNMGVYSFNEQTVRSFLILNDEYFDSDDYADFIDVVNEIRELYTDPWAENNYSKTASQLTPSERYEMWAFESDGGLPLVDRQEIHDMFIEVSNDNGVLIDQTVDANGNAVFYFSMR